MLKENRKKELRLTELAIVVALFAILTAISVPQYEDLTVHAKIAGAKVAMMHIASVVDYHTQELGMKDEKVTWPNCPDQIVPPIFDARMELEESYRKDEKQDPKNGPPSHFLSPFFSPLFAEIP
jgi:Tfp pilus assembly protein PilE